MIKVLFYFLVNVGVLFPTILSGQFQGIDGKARANSSVDSVLVETLATQFLKKTNLPGLSIAVSKDDKIIYANGFGYANVENKTKMTSIMRLRTASVSKVITITALGRLLTQGKIDLDAPIKNYVPYLDERYADLTSRQLAGHTSGMEHRPRGKSHKKKQFMAIKPMVELMDKPLLFEPGLEYKYSTHAFVLLGAVIEGASGMPFHTYMEKEVFKPLNMVRTAPENITELTPQDAQIYYLKNGKLQKEKWTNTSYNLPGAGFRSTPADLVRMMNAYTNGFISKQVADDMFKSNMLKNGEKTNVGIAWRSSYDAFGYKTVEHAGNWLGARTVIVHYPDENMNISIMINAGRQLLIEETAHVFANLFRGNTKDGLGLMKVNTRIDLTFRPNGKLEKYKGNLRLKNGNGVLATDHDGFLNSNPVIYLGELNNYAAITDFGILVLKITREPDLKGEMYVYSTMNKIKPKEQKVLVSFVSGTN